MVRAQGRGVTTAGLCKITPSISFLISYYSLTVDDAAYEVFEAKVACLGCAKVSDGGEQTERRKRTVRCLAFVVRRGTRGQGRTHGTFTPRSASVVQLSWRNQPAQPALGSG
jgi:hypothetical protein